MHAFVGEDLVHRAARNNPAAVEHEPAATVAGPESASLSGEIGLTVIFDVVEVIAALAVSVTVKVCVPEVLSVTLKEPTPLVRPAGACG